MSFPVILTLALALCAAALILLLVRRLTAPGTISECDPEWIANFSLATYRPMLRLLSEDDYKFFASQPGITPKAIEQFRRERRRVFRSYLRSLVKDFHRLHLAARMTLIYSQQDRPELAQILFRQRAVFTWAVLLVEFRLVLHTFGLGPVDARELLGALDAMRMNVSEIAPAAQPASF
jgi:hypothetical protein